MEEDGTSIIGLRLFAISAGDGFGLMDVWVIVER